MGLAETVCDRVVLDTDEEAAKDMTFDAFLAIPLSRRIRYVIEKRARFFAGSDEIESYEALSRLRKAKASD